MRVVRLLRAVGIIGRVPSVFGMLIKADLLTWKDTAAVAVRAGARRELALKDWTYYCQGGRTLLEFLGSTEKSIMNS